MPNAGGLTNDGEYRASTTGVACLYGTVWDGLTLTCHRRKDHAGSHLDTEHDVWYSRNTVGVLVFMPRRIDSPAPSTALRRTATVRKGM